MLIYNCFKSEDCEETKKIQSTKQNETIKEKQTDYDPHEYGKETHPTVFWGPILHLIKAIIGSGILAVPYIFHMVGYGVGVFGTMLAAFLYTHIIKILLEVEYELCKRFKTPNLTYVGVVQNAFKEGPECVKKYAFLAQILVYYHNTFGKCLSNSIYLIIIASNFKIIIDHYLVTDTSVIKIMTFLIIPLIALGLIRQLKFLVPFSMLSTSFSIVNVFLILLISVNHYKKTTEFKAINDVYRFPYFFTMILSALNGTGIMIPLKNDMKNPKRFSSIFGVLNIAQIACATIYVVFGVIGYLQYEDNIKPNVLQNLPPGEFLTLLVLILYSIAICVSFTLYFYIAFDTIWTNLYQAKLSKYKYKTLIEYAMRILVNIIPYLLAVSVPNFKILISISSVVGTLIDLGIPPLLQLLVLMSSEKKTVLTYIKMVKDLCLVLLILLMFGAGLMEVIHCVKIFLTNKN